MRPVDAPRLARSHRPLAPRRAAQVRQQRRRRQPPLLVGLGLVVALLALVWFDVGSTAPGPSLPIAGGAP